MSTRPSLDWPVEPPAWVTAAPSLHRLLATRRPPLREKGPPNGCRSPGVGEPGSQPTQRSPLAIIPRCARGLVGNPFEVSELVSCLPASLAQAGAMPIKSSEDYREDARFIRALAGQVGRENARCSLLGMAELCEYLALGVASLRDRSHQTSQPRPPLSESPSTPP
jgi:hypothetical protein